MSEQKDLGVDVKSKIVELSAFKQKKETDKDIARARRPLYVSQKEGSVSGRSPNAKNDKQEVQGDFSDRLVKIRSSLDRINQLMTEIKKLSARTSNSDGLT